MPNTQNFQTNNFSELSELYPKYTVSRILANKQDDLLDMEVPVEFSDALLQNNIEINLYSLADNSLIFSDVIRKSSTATQIFYTETLQYDNYSVRKLLYIDFSKIIPNLEIPSGRYSVTLNFFADEIGSYDNKILKVSRIATSRTEVELKLTDRTQKQKLLTLAEPRIDTKDIFVVLKQMFNQPLQSNDTGSFSPVKIDSSTLYPNFPNNLGNRILQYNFDDDTPPPKNQIGINTITQNILNVVYPKIVTVTQKGITAGSGSFTQTELLSNIERELNIAYESVIEDKRNNPQKYRFNFI